MTRYWLGLLTGLCTFAWAGQLPPPPPVPPLSPPLPAAADATQDDFLEFLGADDVGDADWWEFLTKTAPGGETLPPATPSQDAEP